MKKQIIALVGAFTLSVAGMTSTVSAAQVKVKDGDTLWTISKEYDVSVASLKKLNHLHSDLILADSTLQLSKKKKQAESFYTIKIGDTLTKIAVKTGISVNKLKSYNQLSNDLIIAGTTLSLTNDNQVIIPGKKQKTKKIATVKKQVAKTTKVSNPVKKENNAQQQSTTTSEKSSRTLTMVATAYTADCPGCTGITATGIDVRNSTPNIIAVDPNVIPLGSKVWVEGYGTAIAGDTGGDIKGNRIDLLTESYDKAIEYGVHTVTVKILN